jgi:glycosyltransferase involved in cell wall biosynthesis
VVVATVSHRGLDGVEDDTGVAVHRLPHLRRSIDLSSNGAQSHHPPFPDPLVTLGLRRLVRTFEPDAVHTHGWISYSCAAALVGSDIPLVVGARDYGYVCANRTLLRDGRACSGPAPLKCIACAGRHYGRPKGWLAAIGVQWSMPLLRRKVSALHCVSSYVEDVMLRHLTAEVSSHVVGDIVDDTPDGDSVATQAVLDKLPDEPFMLFVGAFRREKGIRELLAAYERLDAPPPLVLIGTIERDTPSVFPAGVSVIADVPHLAVLKAWDRSLFGVMPSLLAEPFGTAVAEAMSRGRAVIGTEPGGHADLIVHRKTGLLVPRGDIDALVGAMRLLATDDRLRERLGRAAQTQAAHFIPDASARRLEHVLAATVAARSRPGNASTVPNTFQYLRPKERR